MAREGSKRQIAIDIIKEMSAQPAQEIVEAIALANDLSDSAAKAYFKWIVENIEGVKHTGAPLVSKRGRPKKEGTETVKKAKTEKVKVEKTESSVGDDVKAKAQDFLKWREKKALEEITEGPVQTEEEMTDAEYDAQGVPDFIPDSLRSEFLQGAQAD